MGFSERRRRDILSRGNVTLQKFKSVLVGCDYGIMSADSTKVTAINTLETAWAIKSTGRVGKGTLRKHVPRGEDRKLQRMTRNSLSPGEAKVGSTGIEVTTITMLSSQGSWTSGFINLVPQSY